MIAWLLAGCAFITVEDWAAHADVDGDGFTAAAYGGADCDDDPSNDPDVGPGAAGVHPGATETWYDGVDADCEGDDDYDADRDGEAHSFYGGRDCDDNDAAVWAGADEICDGRDNNCDGYVDDDDDNLVDGTVWYPDDDGDRFGDDRWPSLHCDQPQGFVEIGDDCNDDDMTINPGVEEIWYDDVDQNCDERSDYDQDQDGYTVAGAPTGSADDCDDTHTIVNPGANETWYDEVDQDCSGGTDHDQDGDGSTVLGAPDGNARDCDDIDSSINPTVNEIWYDNVDQDCSGGSDHDADRDGEEISPPGTDCNDNDAAIGAFADEVCDGLDNDCDGDIDDQDNDLVPDVWYIDSDGDGYGAKNATLAQCDEPSGYVANHADCDDEDEDTSPAATEDCLDGVDRDCNGVDECSNTEADLIVEHSQDLHLHTVGDLDDDGLDDSFITERGGSLTFFASGGLSRTDTLDPTAFPIVESLVGNAWHHPSRAVGDISGDGIDDAVVGIADLSLSYIYLGGPSITRDTLSGFAAYDAAGADWNDDGQSDLFVAVAGSNLAVHVFHGPQTSGDASDAELTVENNGNAYAGPTRLAVGDFDGDGDAQMALAVLAKSGTDYVGVVPHGATGSMKSFDTDRHVFFTSSASVGFGDDIATGDLNGDGVDDLAISCVQCEPTGAVYLFHGPWFAGGHVDADATLTGFEQTVSQDLALLDHNGDGELDIAVGGFDSTSTVQLVYSPMFGAVDVADVAVGTMYGSSIQSALIYDISNLGDLDGDGAEDLGFGGGLAGVVWGHP
jgi:hypothetical protein